MKDRNDFINNIREFFDSEDSVALVTGIDDDEKIRMVLNELNENYKKGTMYVNDLGHVGDLLTIAFGYDNKIFPRKITRTKSYSIGNIRLSFQKYSEELFSHSLSENDDFAIYYPVQLALRDEKTFKKLADHIKATKAFKTIIVTTNDIYVDTSKLDSLIDCHIHYEVENDNSSLYNTVKGNVRTSKMNLELNPIYEKLID